MIEWLVTGLIAAYVWGLLYLRDAAHLEEERRATYQSCFCLLCLREFGYNRTCQPK